MDPGPRLRKMTVDQAKTAEQPLLGPSGDAEITEWSAACFLWFRDGSDPTLQDVLTFFEQLVGTDDCCGVGDVAITLEPPPLPRDPVARLLRAAGLLDADGWPIRLPVHRHAAYIAARNQARAEAHRELGMARLARLAELLELQNAAAPVAAGDASLLLTREGAEAMRSRFATFAARYRNSQGTYPFIKGLRSLLQRQLGEEYVLRWVLAEEALTEAGGDGFMADSIELLMSFFHFVSAPDRCGDDKCASNHLGWEVVPQLSDAHLKRLLRILPGEAELDCCATGELAKTATKRINVDGQLDEDKGRSVLLLNWCVVL